MIVSAIYVDSMLKSQISGIETTSPKFTIGKLTCWESEESSSATEKSESGDGEGVGSEAAGTGVDVLERAVEDDVSDTELPQEERRSAQKMTE